MTRCSYFGCTNTDLNKRMFHYPINDWAKFNLWLLHSGKMLSNSRNFMNKYVCVSHFPTSMVKSNAKGEIYLSPKAVPIHYLDMNHARTMREGCAENESPVEDENNLFVRKPAKVYSKKQINNVKVYSRNKGHVTRTGNAETNSNLDLTQTTDTVTTLENKIPVDEDKKQNECIEVYSLDASGSLTCNKVKEIALTNKQTKDSNSDDISVKKELEDPLYVNTNGYDSNEITQEFSEIMKMETLTEEFDIETEPADMVFVNTENECSEPCNSKVELNDPSDSNCNSNTTANNDDRLNINVKEEPIELLQSQVECELGLVHEVSSQETGDIRCNLQEDRLQMDISTRDEILLTEEVIIKEENTSDNEIDTSMTNEQTNVTVEKVANMKCEGIECSDPKVECNDPEVIECTSNKSPKTFELTNDVNDPNKWYMVPKDKQAPPPLSEKQSILPKRVLKLPSCTNDLEPVYCSTCNAKFTYMVDLREHITREHNRSMVPRKMVFPFKCPLCVERFKYDFSLTAHLKQHDSDMCFHCDKCGRIFKTKRGLGKHLNKHTKERVFTCPTCGLTFTERTLLLNHLIKHTANETYRCGFCEKTFDNATDFKTHSSLHMTFFPCKVCGSHFGAEVEMDEHMKIHTKFLECTFCLKQFQDAEELQWHTATHQDMFEKVQESSYVCKICGKRFLYRSMLTTHETTHSSERPFACELCPKRFKTCSARNEHIRGHKKPYKCSDCGKCFARIATLALHRRVHTGEKPYSCHLCDRSFAQRFPLNYHLQRYHGHQKVRAKKSREQQKNKAVKT